MNIRITSSLDEQEITALTGAYKQVFGESNWEEGKKCAACGKKFRLSQAPTTCCQENVTDFYADEQVRQSIQSAQENFGFQIVRLFTQDLSGFSWGWQGSLPEINEEKLSVDYKEIAELGTRSANWFYLSELGVSTEERGRGYGRILLRILLATLPKNTPVILRTSMRSELYSLIQTEGFETVYDYGDQDARILSAKSL